MPFEPIKDNSFQPDHGSSFQPVPIKADAADQAANNGKTSLSQGEQPGDSLKSYFSVKNLASIPAASAEGLIKGASLGNFAPSQLPGALGQSFADAAKAHPYISGAEQLQGGLSTGYGIGSGAAAISPQSTGILASLGRIGMNTGAAALQGYLQKPNEGGDRAHQAKIAAMIAGPLATGAEAYNSLARPAADWTMKQAVGIKKNIAAAEQTAINPETGELESATRGVGNKLIDMGVRGTRDQMNEQVSSRLASEESKLQGLVKDLKGQIQPDEIADAVGQHAQKFTLPSSGKTNPFNEGDLQKVRDISEKVRNLGPMSPEDVLSLNRGAKYSGYAASGNPATSTDALLAQTGAAKSRDILGKLDPTIIDTLGNEQSLVLANKALNKPINVHSGPISTFIYHKTPSLFGSYGATALQKSGEAASSPEVQQALQSVPYSLFRK